MKKILAASLVLATSAASGQEFKLPFKGRWFVMQGGDTPNVNAHMAVRAQWFGMDFMKVGGAGERELSRKENPSLADFYSWDEPVLSPASGTVTAVSDGLPDNPLGSKDPKNPAGNHVVIQVAPKKFVFIAHLRRGSVSVKPGQKINTGDLLGKCGNSGNSDASHIHMHLQDTPVLNDGNGENVVFKSINVELSGKIFHKANWPLIRGLFVWE